MAGGNLRDRHAVKVADRTIPASNAMLHASALVRDKLLDRGHSQAQAMAAAHAAAVRFAKPSAAHTPEATPVKHHGPEAHAATLHAPAVNREAATNAGPGAVNREAATNAGPRAAANREAATNAGPRGSQAAHPVEKMNATQIDAGHIQENWRQLPEHYRELIRQHPVVQAGLIRPEYAYANIAMGMRAPKGERTWDSEFQRNLYGGKTGNAMPASAREAATNVGGKPVVAPTVSMAAGKAGPTVAMTGSGAKAPTVGPVAVKTRAGVGPAPTVHAGPVAKAPEAKPEEAPAKRTRRSPEEVAAAKAAKDTERAAKTAARTAASGEKATARAAAKAARDAARAARTAAKGGGRHRGGKASHGAAKGAGGGGGKGHGGAALAAMARKLVEVPAEALQKAVGTGERMVSGGKR